MKNNELRELIQFMRSVSPRVSPSEKVDRTLFADDSQIEEIIDVVEYGLSLYELYPIFPIGERFSFNNDEYNLRRSLVSELSVRHSKLIQGIIISVNLKNEIALAILCRSLIELYFFLDFLINQNLYRDQSYLERVLHGSQFNRIEETELKKIWKEKHSEDIPSDVLKFLKDNFRLDHIGKFKEYSISHNEGLIEIYNELNDYAHPSFSSIRDMNIFSRGMNEYLEDEKDPSSIYPVYFLEDYYQRIIDNEKVEVLLERYLGISATALTKGFDLFQTIDPMFDEVAVKETITYLESKDEINKQEEEILTLYKVLQNRDFI